MLPYMVALFFIQSTFLAVYMSQSKKDLTKQEKDGYLKALGLHIKIKREEVGINASELAKRMLLDRSHIARIEKGNTNPTSTTLRSIASALEITLEELFKGFNP